MAWLHKRKRKNRDTGKIETYWSIDWRNEQGKSRTRAIGFLSAAEAKKALKVFEGKMAAGDMVGPRTSDDSSSKPRAERPTLREYLDEVYIPASKREKAPSTADNEYYCAKQLKSQMGNLRLDQINFAVVDAYLAERKRQGRMSRTRILELQTLRYALRHARDCGVLEEVPKLPTVKDRDRKPPRFLTPEESVALLDALRPFDEQPHKVTRGKPPINRDRLTYLAVLMGLNLGARKGEILTRRWVDVRWKQGPFGAIHIGPRQEIGFKVKTERSRTIPLSPEVREELEALHREAGSPAEGWIFPSPRDPSKPRTSFNKALARGCERAGIPVVHPHGLRHTWASRLAMAGVDRRTLMELGGWKEGRMLDEIYAHATDAHMESVMATHGLTASIVASSDPASEGKPDQMLDSSAGQLEKKLQMKKRSSA